MVDVPALRKVVDHALSLPIWEEDASHVEGAFYWDQSEWLSIQLDGRYYDEPFSCTITEHGLVMSTGRKCGTSACIAGWTALLLAPNGTKVDGEALTLPDGTQHSIAMWAETRLGLDSIDADLLFAGENDAEDIQSITLRIIEEAEAAA